MLESARSKILRMSLIAGESGGPILLSHVRAISPSNLPGPIQQYFTYAGLRQPSSGLLAVFLAIQCGTSAVLTLRYGLSGCFLSGLPGLIVFICILRRAQNRAERFERDYPAFLLALSSSIRTGLDPLVAFTRSGALFPADSVVGFEIKRSVNEIEAGIDEERVFMGFARSIGHPDIGLLRTALVLSRRQGSSLSACLHRLAKVTRQRQSFRRKVRGAVAMQRLSAFGIAGCTVIVGVIQFTSNPHALRQAWNFPAGRLALSGGLGLVAVGLLWMLHMSRRRQ